MNNKVFYNLVLMTFISTLLFSGCRFGNYADVAKPIPSKLNLVDKEFFATEPKTFEVKSTYADSAGTTQTSINTNTTLSAVPAKIIEVFKTPFIFANVLDVTTGFKIPIFANLDLDSYYETKIENENQIAYEAASGTYTFMYNSNCTTSSKITMQGTLDRTSPTTFDMGDGAIINIAGRNQMDFNYSRRIDGDCADDLYTLAYCYVNGAGCNADLLRFSHDILDLYVNQSGVLDINDVLKLKTLEYTVHFE
jgi:hypothetical protein